MLKPSWDWVEADLKGLIRDRVKESLELDYKACQSLGANDRKKDEISKDVSSFANSAGGTIVYGMLEDGHVPTATDVGFDPHGPVSKEWLEQVINGRIQRRIDGVRVNPVELGETHPGRVAYVVHIPQSMRAPHMAADHRFYKRHNFESVPMEEYEVRDVARRSEAPDLRMLLAFRDGAVSSSLEEVLIPGSISLEVRIWNESATPADYAIIQLEVDERLHVFDPGRLSQLQDPRSVGLSEKREVAVRVLSINWSIPGSMPIWEGIRFLIGPIVLQLPTGDQEYVLGWWVRSPRMLGRKGYYLLTRKGQGVSLRDVAQQPAESTSGSDVSRTAIVQA